MASDLILVPENIEFEATIRGLSISQQVFGRYTLRHVLGRGGMGVVWLGYDERLEREVALKFLPDEVYFDPAALDELKRETQRCLDLTHPNIIRIHDFLKDPQAAAISMEYIDGKTLAALRVEKRERIFEVEEIRNWIAQTCRGLQYAHEEVGVVHRDLKPANLMLTSRGQIKIADFGIAQSMSESISRITLRRGTSGTLAYMSPQQLNGEPSRVTDDVYALGATIYEFLTSKPPFYRGDIPFQVRVNIPRTMAERRVELGITGQEIPKQWEETVAACLAKVPAERPASMNELAELLRLSPSLAREHPGSKTARGKKPAAVQPPPLPRPRPPARHGPWPIRKLSRLGGAFVVFALVEWVLCYFVFWPFVAKPGDIRVASTPVGAAVHLSGRPDLVTPATFAHVRIGHYRVIVSEEGFDPVELPVAVTPGEDVDLGTIQLTRSLGKLSLGTLPRHAHYTLAGAGNTGNFQKEGSTPDFLPDLPSGTYQLTLTEPGFAPSVATIQMAPHTTQTQMVDFIAVSNALHATPECARALRGEINPNQLDDKDRAAAIALMHRAFADYLDAGLLASAADELTQLKNLGLEPAAQQAELQSRSDATEKQAGEQISRLLSDRKFATAAEKLKNLDGVLQKESIDRLTSQFQPTLASYQQIIDAAVQKSQGPPPGAGSAPLETLAGQYPDDLQLQLALADLQRQQAPDHNRLTARLKSLREFAEDNEDFGGEPALLAMESTFACELKQLDALAQGVANAKNGPIDLRSQLASLQAQKDALGDRRVGAPKSNPFTRTLNFFGKAVTGHSVVGTQPYFDSEDDKKEAIAAVEQRMANDQQLLLQPALTVDEAKKKYDDFVAHVPWGAE